MNEYSAQVGCSDCQLLVFPQSPNRIANDFADTDGAELSRVGIDTHVYC